MMVSKNKRYLLLQIVLTLAILVTGASFFLKYETEHITKDKYDDLEIIASLKTEELSNRISKELAHTELLSKNFSILDRVEKYLSSGSVKSQKELSRYLGELAKSHKYKEIIIASPEGQVFVSSNDSSYPTEQQLFSAMQRSVKSKTATSTGLFFSDSQNSISFDVVSPITNREDKIEALLVVREDVDSFIYSIISSWPVPSESGECIIVEREGDSVHFLSNLRFLKNTALKRRIPLTETDVPAVQAVLGKTGIFEGVDYRGVNVIADIHPVQGTNWLMISKIDRDEVFEEFNYRKTLTVMLIAVLFFFIVSSLAVFHYYRSLKYYRQMYEKEREIRSVNDEFRTTLYSIGEGVITTDTDAKIKQMNRIAEEQTGWKEEEAIGKTIHEVFTIINRDAGDKENNPVERVLNVGDIVEQSNHTSLVSRDGTEYQVTMIAAPIKEKGGDVSGAVLVFRDQTSEYNSQLRLEESEKKFRMIFETSPDAITITKLSDGSLIEFNKGFCVLTGFSREEILGKTTIDLGIWLHPAEREELIRKLSNNEKVYSVEMNLHRKDGSIVACYLSACLVEIQGEKYIISINRNVDEKIQSAREVERYRDHLEELIDLRTAELNIANRKLIEEIKKEKEVEAKLEENLEKEIELNRLKSRFIATTSHEFRTPLTIILSSAELIQRNMNRLTEEKVAEYTIRIKNAVFHLTKLMEDIIILNKANTGKLTYEPHTVNLREVCDEVLEASLVYAKEDHKVFFDYHPEETEFHLDRRLLKFILSNILGNAFKFSPEGGTVSFIVQYFEKELIFKIEDEGIGIPEEDRALLFEPFQRSSICEDIPGSGLGLSIAQKAAELQKGSISFESKLNKGSVFKVRIPID